LLIALGIARGAARLIAAPAVATAFVTSTLGAGTITTALAPRLIAPATTATTGAIATAVCVGFAPGRAGGGRRALVLLCGGRLGGGGCGGLW
jgi:hypothetical protein